MMLDSLSFFICRQQKMDLLTIVRSHIALYRFAMRKMRIEIVVMVLFSSSYNVDHIALLCQIIGNRPDIVQAVCVLSMYYSSS